MDERKLSEKDKYLFKYKTTVSETGCQLTLHILLGLDIFSSLLLVYFGAPTDVWVHFVQVTLVRGPYFQGPFVRARTDERMAICPGEPYVDFHCIFI